MPKIVTKAEHQRRLDIYRSNPGASNAELAALAGIHRVSYTCWRMKAGLKAASREEYMNRHAVKMEEALSPEECRKMRCFLQVMAIAREYIVEDGQAEISLPKIIQAWEHIWERRENV